MRIFEQGFSYATAPLARVHCDGSQLSISGIGASDRVSYSSAPQPGYQKEIRTMAMILKETMAMILKE